MSTTEQYEVILEWGRQSAEESELVKRRQIRKFDELPKEVRPWPRSRTRWYVTTARGACLL